MAILPRITSDNMLEQNEGAVQDFFKNVCTQTEQLFKQCGIKEDVGMDSMLPFPNNATVYLDDETYVSAYLNADYQIAFDVGKDGSPYVVAFDSLSLSSKEIARMILMATIGILK